MERRTRYGINRKLLPTRYHKMQLFFLFSTLIRAEIYLSVYYFYIIFLSTVLFKYGLLQLQTHNGHIFQAALGR